MLKRIFCLILCLLMIGSMFLFTACGKDKEAINDDSSESEEINDTEKNNDNEKNEESNSSEESTDAKIILNPFENIEIMYTGISPYCKASINTAKCSVEVQEYVTYTFDKEQYANGDKVIVTATLDSSLPEEYVLSDEKFEDTVKDCPEYIVSLENVDLTELKEALDDYIISKKAEVVATSHRNNYLFSLSNFDAGAGTSFTAVDDMKLKETYFSSLKAKKQSDFNLGKVCFNRLSFIYEVDYSWKNGNQINVKGTGTAWFNISAQNIVRYPDGHIEWGVKSIGASDFSCAGTIQGADACVTSTIMVNTEKYNISKVN